MTERASGRSRGHASTNVIKRIRIGSRPVGRYSALDSDSFTLIDLQQASKPTLLRELGIKATLADWLIEQRKRALLTPSALAHAQPRMTASLAKLHARSFYADETPLHIVDVVPRKDRVMSDKPFNLDISFQNFGKEQVALASVTVHWSGDPFVVQQRVTRAESKKGVARIAFDRERSLPVGQAEFRVALYREDGAHDTFRRSVFVLPSNPLSLNLSPAGATVTGSWSARGDHQPVTDTFLTECQITIANGDGSTVNMNRRVNWEFWDGPVGSGTRIESGAFDWPGAIAISPFSVWRGSVWFSSPRGSGIYNSYARKEDMALSISMTAMDGRVVRGEITTRVMLAYGVNIIKVGNFGAAEHTDLYNAVDQMRQIYEQRDITLRGVQRYIINNSQAGGYTVINSETEFRDLLEDWSVPNDFVDVYVVQDFQWSTFNGFAGDIPGPTTKTGRRDGLAVEKTGFTDATGTMRLDVTTLAQLIGHEVGHYLGLPHLEDANNLMRSNTGNRGPNLNYTQYRMMFPHGFMVYL
jgi:hypothetical protein